MKELLENYTKYNLWANSKLTSFIKKLDPAMLDKELISSFKSIRKTVYHIWDSEQIWYNRLSGISFTSWPSESRKGTDDEFMGSFIEQSVKFIGFVENKTEAELLDRFEYKSLEGKPYSNRIADTVLHCMNHSTFHRGQIVTMLRNTGFTDISSTDFITYIREMKI